MPSSVANALTVLNPTRPLASYIAPLIKSCSPKSVFAVATPQLAPALCNLSQSLTSLQLVAASVDATPPADQRNAVSFLLSQNHLSIKDYVSDQADSESSSSSSSSSSGSLVSSRKNWSLPQSFLAFDIAHTTGASSTITLPIASTLFTTGSESTLFFQDSSSSATFVKSLSLSLPTDIRFSQLDNISPLRTVSGPLTITGVAKNMIKTLDKKPAASFLENAPEIMQYDPTASPHDRKVFAQVLSTGDRFEVIAGGGGTWSPRSAMLVLEPRANLKLGEQIQFLVTTSAPQEPVSLFLENSPNLTLALECVAPQESVSEPSNNTDMIIDNVFGLASEQGFLVNDRKYAVPGEITWANCT